MPRTINPTEDESNKNNNKNKQEIDEEASRIMQWKNYTPGLINTNTLKDAIDNISANIGTSYSEPIKYYNFKFPEANKMTLITETANYPNKNSFSIIVPGVLHEASYFVYVKSGVYEEGGVDLKLDSRFSYGYF